MFTLLCISEEGLHVLDHRNVLTSQVKHDTLPSEKVEYSSSLFPSWKQTFCAKPAIIATV